MLCENATASRDAHPGVMHCKAGLGGEYAASVSSLPALLCVEGRTLQHKPHLCAVMCEDIRRGFQTREDIVVWRGLAGDARAAMLGAEYRCTFLPASTAAFVA